MIVVTISIPEILLIYFVAHFINYMVNYKMNIQYYNTEIIINRVIGLLLLCKLLE